MELEAVLWARPPLKAQVRTGLDMFHEGTINNLDCFCTTTANKTQVTETVQTA